MTGSEVPPGKKSNGDLPAPASSSVNPEALRNFRAQLTKGEDAVDPATWAGSVPAQ